VKVLAIIFFVLSGLFVIGALNGGGPDPGASSAEAAGFVVGKWVPSVVLFIVGLVLIRRTKLSRKDQAE